jgi:ElaB/YqjD/DUF883 family membrane-anchored ribosome-binding protein
MIPEIKDYKAENRRRSDVALQKSLEIIERMNEESKQVNAEVRRMLDDTEKLISIRFDHVDANIQQIREDNKAFYEHILQRMDEKHASQDKKIADVEGCVGDGLKDLGKQIGDIEARVKILEDAPVKKSASRWDQASDKILWALIGLVVAGVISWISTAVGSLTGGGQK